MDASYYILVDIISNPSNSGDLYKLININGPYVLSKQKLRVQLSQNRVKLINANLSDLSIRDYGAYEEFILKYFVKQLSEQDNLRYYPLMLDIIRVLRDLSEISHLGTKYQTLVKDLLRMISVYFNYMRPDKVDKNTIANLFKVQLKYPKGYDSIYEGHKNKLLNMSNHISINVQLRDWLQKAKDNPFAYDEISTMLYNEWTRSVNITPQARHFIQELLSILDDFFSNVKYTGMGWYMYSEYAQALGKTCKESLVHNRFRHNTVGINLPDLSASERKQKIQRCSSIANSNFYTYLSDLNSTINDLNSLVETYGEDTKALLSAIPIRDKKKLKVNVDNYFNELKLTKDEVKGLFDETRNFLNERPDVSIMHIILLLELGGMIIGALSNGSIWAMLPSQELQEFTKMALVAGGSLTDVVGVFIEGASIFQDKIKNTVLKGLSNKSKAFLKEFSEKSNEDLAVVMYKLSKASYFKTPVKNRGNFIYYNYNDYLPVLLPMLSLVTKNIDFSSPYNLQSVRNIKVNELVRDVSLDVSWCTMFLFEQTKMKITNLHNVYRPTFLWHVFLDTFRDKPNSEVSSEIFAIQDLVKRYLKDCKWYIDDNINNSLLLNRMCLR